MVSIGSLQSRIIGVKNIFMKSNLEKQAKKLVSLK